MSDDVLNMFTRAGAYLKGHFLLTSGLHSDVYFEKFLLLQYPDLLGELCRRLAAPCSSIGPTVRLHSGIRWKPWPKSAPTPSIRPPAPCAGGAFRSHSEGAVRKSSSSPASGSQQHPFCLRSRGRALLYGGLYTTNHQKGTW